jgi:hypothetical protein
VAESVVPIDQLLRSTHNSYENVDAPGVEIGYLC